MTEIIEANEGELGKIRVAPHSLREVTCFSMQFANGNSLDKDMLTFPAWSQMNPAETQEAVKACLAALQGKGPTVSISSSADANTSYDIWVQIFSAWDKSLSAK